MDNIKTLLTVKRPELQGVRIIEEHYEVDGRIKYVFENGEVVKTSTISLIDEVIGMVLKK